MTKYGWCPACHTPFKLGDLLISRVSKMADGRFGKDFRIEDVHLKCPNGEADEKEDKTSVS